MKIERVEVLPQFGVDFDMIFHMDDGNQYTVKAQCCEYMTQEERNAEEYRKEREEKWADFETEEDYRQAHYRKQGWKGFKRKRNPYQL